MDVPVTRQSGFNKLLRGAGTATPQEVIGLRGKNDGNNVDIDRKARLLSENSIRFNAATNLMKDQFRRIKSAIHEGQGARASFLLSRQAPRHE
jgi:flagellar basal-body rod protein FlgB